MFDKIVAIEPIGFVPEAEKELEQYAGEIVYYKDIPKDDEEILRRIGDADGVLLSYTSKINKYVLERCQRVRYIGMCCSLYSEESANVDIAYAREKGITVRGIRDYGDRGVVEYVLSELVRLLHGYDRPMWQDLPLELTKLKVGVIGMGVSGRMVAEALQFMGADVSYYSRSRKPEVEEMGISFLELHPLLGAKDVIFCCLNKNVILLHEEEFQIMGNHKILFNTSIGPAFDVEALKAWLDGGDNYFCCDTLGALGDATGTLNGHQRVFSPNVSAGRTKQAFDLLSQKVLENIKTFLL